MLGCLEAKMLLSADSRQPPSNPCITLKASNPSVRWDARMPGGRDAAVIL